MRPASSDQVEALTGGRGIERLAVSAWYDGAVTIPALHVVKWSLRADASRAVQSTLRLTVADPDGTLSPWSVTDPLGVAGQQVRPVYQWGTPGSNGYTQTPLGVFPIVRADPVDHFVNYARPGYPARWVPAGSEVELACEDPTEGANVSFPGAEAPRPGATRLGEIRRVLHGIIPVHVAPGVIDRPTGSEAYTGTRLAAVEDHAAALSLAYRVESDGMLYLYPAGQKAPVWAVRGGHDGALVEAIRSYQKADLVNAGVAESSGGDREIVARAPLTSGPLRWGGPLGYRPRRHASPLYTTQGAAAAGAATVLANAQHSRATVLKIMCAANPFVELGDWWDVGLPTPWGEITVTGEVVAYTLTGDSGGVGPMGAEVRVSEDHLTAAIGKARS